MPQLSSLSVENEFISIMFSSRDKSWPNFAQTETVRIFLVSKLN